MTIRLKHFKPLITAAVFAASSAAYLATTSAQNQPMSFFITSAGSGDGANLGGLAGADKICQTLAKAAGAGEQDLARIPERERRERSACGQRARSHREGPLVQRQGRAGGEQRCRSAQRQQQAGQGDLADGEGRGRQRPRRHAEHARHPDRIECGRDAVEQGRQHLRQLDQEHGRVQHARAGITTSRAAATRRTPGTPHTIRRAAARRIWLARAAPGCSTASRSTDGTDVVGVRARNGRCRDPGSGNHRKLVESSSESRVASPTSASS